MSLHSTQAPFDPLSASGDDKDGAFTTVFDSGSLTSAAAAPPLGPAAAGAGADAAAPSSEYDSFMTARSNMSYMTASQGGAAAAPAAPAAAAAAPPPPASGLFRRLPDRPAQQAPAHFGGGGGGADPYDPLADLPASPAGDANPFMAPAPPPPQPQTQTRRQPAAPAAALGPLSFGDDAPGSSQAPPSTTFAMPLDLYDAPDAFARPVAAQAPAAAPLPPLHDFAREFSRVLPVSQDPISPAGGSVTSATTGWYDNSYAPSSAASGGGGAGGGGGYVIGAGAGPSVSAAASGAGGGGGLMPYAAAALLTNTVSVHSPRKAVMPSRFPGLSEPYVVYRVTSRSATTAEATVDRRFRDVVALGELLATLYPGCFVPPRPSRNAVDGRRMLPAFVEERRQGIERFLRRLVVHPVMGPSEATQVWLRSPTPDLRTSPEWLRLQPSAPPGLAKSTARLLFQVVGRERTVPSPVEVTRSASDQKDMYRLVHERAAQMRGVLQRVQPSSREERLREEAASLQERCDALMTLSRRADHFVFRSTKAATVVGDLAKVLGAAAEADLAAEGAAPEAVGPTPAAALRATEESGIKVGKLYCIATDASAKHLMPLHDWLAAAPGAAAGLAARERCLLTVATLEADEREARTRLAEAEARAVGAAAAAASPPPAALKKVEALRLLVSQLAVAVAAARDEYERVGSRNAAELAAFKAHMSRELADSVREFALVQLAAAQKAQELWQEAAGALATLAAAAAPGGGGGGGYGTYRAVAAGGF